MKESSKEFGIKDIDNLKASVKKAARSRKESGSRSIENLLKEIKIGDRVRCFVFFGEKEPEGDKANWFEGEVLAIDSGQEEIRVRIEKEVRDGKEVTDSIGNDVPVAANPESIEVLKR